jgi:hypothetical protein
MPSKLLALLPVLLCVALFLTGALNHPPAEPAPPAETPFVAQAVALPADLAGLSGERLLDRALARVAPDRLAWLRVRIWQRMSDDHAAFESDGVLQLAPRHCARLDVTVRTAKQISRLLVVSDGHALAEVSQQDGSEPVVVSQLIASDETTGETPKTPAEVLRERGCGGPYPLLCDLRNRLQNIGVQTGLWHDRPVVRLAGSLPPGQVGGESCPAVVPEFCYLYMDARTLWPARVEWRGTDRKGRRRPLLQVEYREPELNRPLSLPECMRAFSYHPAGG